MFIPTESRLEDTGMIPAFEIAPWEDLNPRTPQYPAGTLTPPTVSMPAMMQSHQNHTLMETEPEPVNG